MAYVTFYQKFIATCDFANDSWLDMDHGGASSDCKEPLLNVAPPRRWLDAAG
jgi:hypothetical protein